MAVIKCKMCGGDIEIAPDKTFGTCEYCGSTMTLPKIDDDQRAAAFNRGNHFRRQGEFDKALAVYERIVAEDDTDAEAHWCCALCRFGIEYVEDPATYEYIPTCHRASFDSILEDVDYLAALKHSNGITKRQYQKDAAKIAEVQRGILATSQKEEPFDVFICYKETDADTGERSRDSIDAQEVYYQLTEKGYRVFFARVTLEDKAGAEYEPYIFAALNSAKVMIVLGEKPEHFSAVWVKNEWSRYLSLMKRDRSRLLLPCYKNMDPYDLPEQLAVLQSYDMGKIGFIQDLIRGVDKVLRKDEPKEAAPVQPVVQQTVVQSAGGANLTAQLKRGQQALEDRDWQAADTFFDKALDMDAECAEAFFGKALAAANCSSGEELALKRVAQAQPEKKTLTACERDSARIKDAVERYSIPEYFPAETVRKCFSYDKRTFISYTAGWMACIENEQDYWEKTERNLSRALRYAKGETERGYQTLRDKVITALNGNLKSSIAADEKEKAQIAQLYAEEMEKASQNAAVGFEAAKESRRNNYESYCRLQEKATTIDEYVEAAKCFERDGLHGYEDCDERAEWCMGEANRLAEEVRTAAEAEAKAKAEERERQRIAAERAAAAKKKKKRTIASIAAAVVVVLVAGFFVTTKVIIPNANYNKALALKDSGDYEAAIEAFEALSDYKDSKAIVTEIKVAHPELWRKNCTVGDVVLFGSYEQDNNQTNGKENIEWLVLVKEDDRVLVISRYGLDCQPYNASDADVTWETCSLREWLNGEFLSTAFSTEEQAMIPSVTVSADNHPAYSTSPGNSTTDQVFLQSVIEASKYFSSDEARKCAPTAYAIAQGAQTNDLSKVDGKATCWWWLRSPGGHSSNVVALVDTSGSVHGGGLVDSDYVVRPALWIDISA